MNMAKTTAPLLSFGASGSLAKTMVASKWKGRPYMRQHVVPANPNSTAQQSTRLAFSFASNVWKSMGSIGVAPWDRFATGQVLTGRNAMTGKFVSFVRGEADLALMQFSPGAKGGIAPSDITLTPAAGQITVDFTNPAPPTGWTLTAAQAVIIIDQDYLTPVTYLTAEDEDTVTKNQIVFAGLDAATDYVVGGWLKWAKPDGSVAYGASITKQATTP